VGPAVSAGRDGAGGRRRWSVTAEMMAAGGDGGGRHSMKMAMAGVEWGGADEKLRAVRTASLGDTDLSILSRSAGIRPLGQAIAFGRAIENRGCAHPSANNGSRLFAVDHNSLGRDCLVNLSALRPSAYCLKIVARRSPDLRGLRILPRPAATARSY
jgi:hypothetical protein